MPDYLPARAASQAGEAVTWLRLILTSTSWNHRFLCLKRGFKRALIADTGHGPKFTVILSGFAVPTLSGQALEQFGLGSRLAVRIAPCGHRGFLT
jgi:hypothetical protein